MKAIVIHEPGGEPGVTEMESAGVTADDVEVRVKWCALCHSDLHLVDNDWGSTVYPLVPGHEIVGEISALGSNVATGTSGLQVGDLVGIGWQAGACHECDFCDADNEHLCETKKVRTCVGRSGGLAERVVADHRFVFPIPKHLPPEQAAPLLCAGVTVYSPLHRFVKENSLKENGARKTKNRAAMRVGICGVGGLGHLAIQFAKAMQCEVIAFDPIAEKADEARRFGADKFFTIDQLEQFLADETALDLLLITTFADLDWNVWLKLVAVGGIACLTGIPQKNLVISPEHLLDGQKMITGSIIGSPKNIRQMLAFAAEHQIVPQTESFPMSRTKEALQRMRNGLPRYRIVLENDF